MTFPNRPQPPVPKLAFPALVDLGTGLQCADFGMTLRDYFAGQAMPIVIDQSENFARFGGKVRSDALSSMAGIAYEIADAMMKARDAK